MREHLFELSVLKLKELYIHETKALTFALESGVPWEDLQYIRESLKDITRCIDVRVPASKNRRFKKNEDNLPPFPLSPDYISKY